MIPNRIVLAALTYHRPEGLARLLHGLAQVNRPDHVDCMTIIVDNSATATAQNQVMQAAKDSPIPLQYRHCAERGLSPARNMALEFALDHDADLLGFIDDDEVPSPSWLLAHLNALTVGDASMGPVKPAYDVSPPDWLRRGRFLEFGGYPRHGALVDGSTSNTLFRLAPVRRHTLRFEARFALTGGEDTAFFHRYRQVGGRIVYAPEAVVTETIVKDRARLRWLLRRWRRTGQTSALIRMRDNSPGWRCALGGMMRICTGLAMATIAAPASLLGRADLPVRGLRIAARGLGFLDTTRGYQTEEYRVMTR